MMIDKIGGISPNLGPKKTAPVSKKSEQVPVADSVQISSEATQAAEHAKIMKLALSGKETERSEHLKTVRERLDRGDYDQLSDEQLNTIVSSLSQTLIGQA